MKESKAKNIDEKLLKEKKVTFNDMLTASGNVKKLYNTAKQIAQTEVTVLISGESGTGKELVAQAIHNSGPRSKGPFIAVNCAGMPETLLESELFGHEKGAYTDAVSQKKGKFELASGGTLFLDEIADLSVNAQAKVLRAVEEKRFERVGGENPVFSDCRIIAATNKDLFNEMKSGKFREDLYYRLHESQFKLPPLRERMIDLPMLMESFIKEYNKQFGKRVKGVSDVTLAYLMKHNWPGNIRELKSVIKGGMALARSNTIWLEDLPFKVELNNISDELSPLEDFSLKATEKKHIYRVLDHVNWNKARAADLLKISRPTLNKKIKEYGIKKSFGLKG